MIVCLTAISNVAVIFTLFGLVCAQIKTAEVVKTLWKLVISPIQNLWGVVLRRHSQSCSFLFATVIIRIPLRSILVDILLSCVLLISRATNNIFFASRKTQYQVRLCWDNPWGLRTILIWLSTLQRTTEGYPSLSAWLLLNRTKLAKHKLHTLTRMVKLVPAF